MRNLSDEKQLIEACLEDDLRAQKMLYHRYARKMMGVCLRYAKSWEEAEDLLQEGFLKIFVDLKQYNGNGSFEGWMRKVIVNTALQHIRKRKQMFFSNIEIEQIEEADFSYKEVFYKFEKEELLKLLKRLPEGCQLIFNLYALEGFTHKEIGEQLNISIGTSKSQLSKARALLKKSFQKLTILI